MYSEYDNERFFMEYAKMARSRDGLRSAGEWRQLKPLFPPLQGKDVLDLGCGYGWHCRFAAERGAAQVLGLDLSAKMIAEAKARGGGCQIQYRICGIEEYEYPQEAWDCVVSNLALHYVENIETIFRNVHRTLRQDGIFLFNIEHPVFTAGVGQDWIYTEEGRPKYWPIDHYFLPGERHTRFLGCDVIHMEMGRGSPNLHIFYPRLGDAVQIISKRIMGIVAVHPRQLFKFQLVHHEYSTFL